VLLTAKDRQALVIVDRAGWHMMKAIRCFSNVTLLPLPPYSPELNPVEQLFIPIYAKVSINTKFKKQLNQKTPLPTTQIFNKTILT
jgi:transposase